MSSHPVADSLRGFVQKRYLAASPLAVFIGGVALGWAIAPSYRSLGDHQWFSTFFGTSAQVIATLFVGYALGARFFMASVGIAIATVALVGVSEIAAVAALSPSLPSGAYAPLTGLTIGGGLGALLAAILSAARVAAAEHAARETALAKALGGTVAQSPRPGEGLGAGA
jgi:hypothetical protein